MGPTRDVAQLFVRWTCVRAVFHRGYWLVTSLYLVVEADLKPYDFSALIPIVCGAGGAVSDWNGDDITLESDGRIIAAGNPALLPQAVEVLNSP